MTIRTLQYLLVVCLFSACSSRPHQVVEPVNPVPESHTDSIVVNDGQVTITPQQKNTSLPRQGRLMYTTYFYTASEAVVHGYEPDTKVRIVSMESGQSVWSGEVGVGETQLVSTGRGVFSFLADKKATILVGTPSSCTVVGYWVRDEDGGFRSDHFYTQLPSSVLHGNNRVIVWAWDQADVRIVDRTTDQTLRRVSLPQYGRVEIPADELRGLTNHVLDIRSSSPAISVQVYYDEGFTVPAESGRTSGTDFMTYIGSVTEGVNDLLLISYFSDVHVNVQDINSGEVIFDGTVGYSQVHTLTLQNRHVRIRSNGEISVMVAPYEHYRGTYAEHHYSGGSEGMGIDTNFILPTPNELWIFSFFNNNSITVENFQTGQVVWTGTLQAGSVQGLHPGHGLYRVRGTTGMSVMGGSQACGAEFSPSGRLFEVDEALFQAVNDIREARQRAAEERGEDLDDEALNAPLTEDELEEAARAVRRSTGNSSIDASQAQERIQNMHVE